MEIPGVERPEERIARIKQKNNRAKKINYIFPFDIIEEFNAFDCEVWLPSGKRLKGNFNLNEIRELIERDKKDSKKSED